MFRLRDCTALLTTVWCLSVRYSQSVVNYDLCAPYRAKATVSRLGKRESIKRKYVSANSKEFPAASYSSSWPPTWVNLDEIQIFPDQFSSCKRTLDSPCLHAGEASVEDSGLYIDSSVVPSRFAFKLCSLDSYCSCWPSWPGKL